MAMSYDVIAAPLVTALNGLAAAAYWVSATFLNNTNLAFEVEIFITIKTTATAGSDGSCNVYIAGSNDGGTNFAGSVTGVDTIWTPVGDDVSHLKPLGSIKYTNETTIRTQRKRFVVTNVPKDFKIVIFNGTGAALGAADCKVEWNAIKY